MGAGASVIPPEFEALSAEEKLSFCTFSLGPSPGLGKILNLYNRETRKGILNAVKAV